MFKYINNLFINIVNGINIQNKSNRKLELYKTKESKIRFSIKNELVGDTVYYIIKVVSDIINILSFYLFGKYITKDLDIFNGLKLGGYNYDDSENKNSSKIFNNFIVGALSSKLYFTNYANSNLDIFSILLSYFISIGKFSSLNKKNLFFNLLHVGRKNDNKDCFVENENVNKNENKIENENESKINITGGSDEENDKKNNNVLFGLIFNFFLSFDTYINDNIFKLVYIILKILSVVFLITINNKE